MSIKHLVSAFYVLLFFRLVFPFHTWQMNLGSVWAHLVLWDQAWTTVEGRFHTRNFGSDQTENEGRCKRALKFY